MDYPAKQRCGRSHRGLGLPKIEQLAGEYAALTPPLIRILKRHGLGRGCPHQPGSVGKPIVMHQPLDAAQRIAQILAGLGRNCLEQCEGLACLLRDTLTGLDD